MSCSRRIRRCTRWRRSAPGSPKAGPIHSSIPVSSMPMRRRWRRRSKRRSSSKLPQRRKRRGDVALEGRAGLSARRALRVHIERVDRLARGREEAVALPAAKAEVGAALVERDTADYHAGGGEHDDAVEFGIAYSPG